VVWFKNMKENGNLEDLSTDGRKILRWTELQGGLIKKLEEKWPLIRPKTRCEEYTKMNRVSWFKNLRENQLYQYDIWYMSLCIYDRLVRRFGWDCDSSKPAHQTVIYTEWHIPHTVLIQLILLMMGTWVPETSRE